jgi:demethylmenaquinone methyltransferase/2-methoxy-6-polyprenyl-1,4-benzoquinol methylase
VARTVGWMPESWSQPSMQPTEPNRSARTLFDGLPARYDLLSALLSFGQDRRWRKAMLEAVCGRPPAGGLGRSLDVATGPGGVALALARRSGAWVAGVDVTPEMLGKAARNIASSAHGGRVALALGRAEDLPFPDATFDAVTFTYLLRYVADPAATVKEIARVAKPGAIVASLEFHPPPRTTWHAFWLAYTRAVLPVLGFVLGGREWWEVGRFLGPSITGHYRRYPLSWHIAAWESAGFCCVRARLMSLGGGLVMWGNKVPHDGSGA